MFKFFTVAVTLLFLIKSVIPHPHPGIHSSNIVGGNNVNLLGAFPYQAEILYEIDSVFGHLSAHICGGSIVASNYILTAAHCVFRRVTEKLRVRVGNIFKDEGGQTSFSQRIIIHPFYNILLSDYDVSLIELKNPFTYNRNVQSIKLSKSTPPPGSEAFITGWGVQHENDRKGSNILKFGIVPIWDTLECKTALSSNINVTDRMICAGYPSGGTDTCQADSGGPLVFDNKLVGVVSWGAGCGRPNKPGIYIDVSKVIEWINSIIGK